MSKICMGVLLNGLLYSRIIHLRVLFVPLIIYINTLYYLYTRYFKATHVSLFHVAVSTRIWSSPYSGQIRLTGGSTVNQGLVEVYCSGQWGTVCDDLFGQFEANTVCRQLGYERAYDYDHLSM